MSLVPLTAEKPWARDRPADFKDASGTHIPHREERQSALPGPVWRLGARRAAFSTGDESKQMRHQIRHLQHLLPNSFLKPLGKAWPDPKPLHRAVTTYSPFPTPETCKWQVFSPSTSAKCFNASVGGLVFSNLFSAAQKGYTAWERWVSWEWGGNRKIQLGLRLTRKPLNV